MSSARPEMPPRAQREHLAEVAKLFLKLGCIAFGGPAAHIAMMRDEVVNRRKWLTDQEFLDLLGATNLIPGPNSTEMAIHLGFRRAGWPGLIVGGVLFIVPAMLLVLACAWAYMQYGSTPQAFWLLYGVKPVIIAVVLHALWGLLKTAVKGPLLALVGIGVLVLYFFDVNEILLMFGGGAVVALLLSSGQRFGSSTPRAPAFALGTSALLPLAGQVAATAAVPFSHGLLFLTFLKIGSVLYGSGYVLLAFVQSEFVEGLGWLNSQQLLDAVAVGQFTPGPLFTTATFIGYLVGGFWGAVLATIGIFLPGFIFVAAVNPLVPKLRQSKFTGAVLDGVNVAALGLMAAVTWELGRSAIVDVLTVVLALASAVLLFRTRLNSAWIVLGGAVAGALAHIAGVVG